MITDTSDALIVGLLLRRREISLYNIHTLFLLSPEQIQESLYRLSELGILNFDRSRAWILAGARRATFQNRRLLFERSKSWRYPPEQMLSSDDFDTCSYLPNFRRIDRQILKLLAARGSDGAASGISTMR